MRPYLEIIERFAREKFVLIAGARQVGKTTLAKAWLGDEIYLNWDSGDDRREILSHGYLSKSGKARIVLDEFHKFLRWKNYLKIGFPLTIRTHPSASLNGWRL